ncbi:MAG TPA: DNA/RNA helicase domain-containing protein [Rhodocyclaceae bacterium]|nr:DNA/RNA helicase domain-containing protein [Rhodocyclaceae bacterium]
MAIFIPERLSVAGARSLHLKRALASLDDDYTVRTPLKRAATATPSTSAPDFFIRHESKGWLALVVDATPFASLAAGQLFPDRAQSDFETMLNGLRALDRLPDAAKLVVMWSCTPYQVGQIADYYRSRFGVRLRSKAQLLERAAECIDAQLAPLAPTSEQKLMAQYFPEAEIPAAHTTRRFFYRDNAAKLPRFFLDPRQEAAAKLDLDLPHEQAELARDAAVRLINGVAGSGKTLIALARALMLAERHPHEDVLMLIHNAPIVADLKARLQRSRGALPANLEIDTFCTWAHRQWRALQRAPLHLPDSNRMVEDLIEQLRPRWPELRPTAAQLREEIDFINDSLLNEIEPYLDAKRPRRGFTLKAAERMQLWELHRELRAALLKTGLRLWSAVPFEICHAEDTSRLEKYRHILIDEAQFFAPAWFQAVRRSTLPGGSLFLCADPNQGFMKNGLSWKSLGLDVVGRTRKLHRSYRTTAAILAAANRLLAQNTADDPEDFLIPDLSGMTPGYKPALLYADTPQDCIDRLVNELHALVAQQQLNLSDLLVIYGENIAKNLLFEQLCRRFGADNVWWLKKREQRKSPPQGGGRDYLRLANLETATGLEASVVFLVGIDNLLAAAEPSEHRDDAHQVLREESARKLYMAMTRAGQHLILMLSQPAPERIARVCEPEPEPEP